jgi:signal transduction histidine kinase
MKQNTNQNLINLNELLSFVETRKVKIIKGKKIYIQADKNKLLLKLFTLVHNAQTHGKGKISVRFIPHKNGFVSIEIMNEGGLAREKAFATTKKKIMEKINDPRGFSSTGSGLGLVSVHKFAKKHNGELYIKPRIRKGQLHTAIGIRLPQYKRRIK